MTVTGPGGRLSSQRRGMAARIALAAVASAALSIAILSAGVAIVGAAVFTELMVAHGETAEAARAVFGQSVLMVLAATILVAAPVSVVLSLLVARRLARPLAQVSAAARRIADGDPGVRVPRNGPEEIVELADSFNQMADSLAAQEQLRRDFIANAAHELRTPLTNLQGYLEALRDGVVTADRATYESLSEEVDRLVRLARSLDALVDGEPAAGSPSRLVETDLAAAIRSAVELARPALDQRRIAIAGRWPERLPVRADPDHLAQVLANLLQNAARYGAEGSEITVAAETRPDSVLVSVTNSGELIPPDDLPHVFERFYRVEKSRDRARGGAGIGLAIVKQLVEAAGGHVGAESSAGRTRFWFSLLRSGR